MSFSRKYYSEQLEVVSDGIFGKQEYTLSVDEALAMNDATLVAFVNDNDYQQIQLCSTNLGVVRTVRKNFRKQDPNQ